METTEPSFNPVETVTSFVAVVRRRHLLVLTTLMVGLIGVALVFFLLPRTFAAASRVLIVPEADGRAPSITSADLPLVATSTDVLSRVLDDTKIPVSLITLKKALKAHVADRSSIMEISYQDESPDQAIAVPNAVADELTRYYSAMTTDRADNDVRNAEKALDDARNRMQSVNAQLAALTARYPFLGADKPLDDLSHQMDTLQQQRALAFATMSGDQASADAVSPASPAVSQIARHEKIASDQVYGQLSGTSSKDAAQLALDKVTYTARFPGLDSLEQKVAAESLSLNREAARRLSSSDAFSTTQAQSAIENAKAAALVTGDRIRVGQIDRLLATAKTHVGEYRDAGARYDWLTLQHTAAQADYLALSTRRTTAVADRAQSQNLGSLVVVDRAVRANTTVVGMGRTHLALIMTLVVAFMALGSAFLAEMLDPSLRRSKQIEQLYGTPLITTLGGVQ